MGEKLKQTLIKLNGKKLSLTTLVILVGSYFTLQAQVKHNTEDLVKVAKAPIEIAEIKKDVGSIKEDISDMKLEQRTFRGVYREDQRIMQQDLKEIIKALK